MPSSDSGDEGGVADLLLGPGDVEQVILGVVDLELLPVLRSAAFQFAVAWTT
ncbi:hypothetical protein ACFXPY_48025 [Streptomyces sp. NPDC059153]|uniref:hypothetical protein n=1 Tax=Streptomyces sp. NPDC059153 TaxID=3346743 RepID=UPI0036BFF32E